MLYFVPTPIGNLEDITVRAKRILSESKIVIAEDPSKTMQLFNLLGIAKPEKFIQLSKNQEINWKEILPVLESLSLKNSFNDNKVEPRFLKGQSRTLSKEDKLKVEQSLLYNISIVCDAGSPGISDPGKIIVQKLWEIEVLFTILPGATSLIPTIVASGMITEDWTFRGFLPIKKGRQTFWKEQSTNQTASIIFESVHRMEKTVLEMKQYLPANRLVFIAREISKLHETYWRGKVEDLDVKNITFKGEFVLVIGGFEDII